MGGFSQSQKSLASFFPKPRPVANGGGCGKAFLREKRLHLPCPGLLKPAVKSLSEAKTLQPTQGSGRGSGPQSAPAKNRPHHGLDLARKHVRARQVANGRRAIAVWGSPQVGKGALCSCCASPHVLYAFLWRHAFVFLILLELLVV